MQRKRPAKPLSPDETLQKMEAYCAYQERSPQEVQSKLKDLGMRGDEAEQILQVLAGDGFFDEQRFAHAYAGGKFRSNHWGRIRIRLGLRHHQVDAEVIEQAIQSIGEVEYEKTLRMLALKKLKGYGEDEQAKEKTAAALIRAGFEPHLVFALLRNLPGLQTEEFEEIF